MRIWRWLQAVELDDPVERKLAPLLQLLLIGLMLALVVAVVEVLIRRGGDAIPPDGYGVALLFELTMLALLLLVRHGHFGSASWVLLLVLFLTAARRLWVTDADHLGDGVLSFFLVLTVAGVLCGRRALLLTLVVSSVMAILVSYNQHPAGEVSSTTLTYILNASLICFLLDLLSSTLRRELAASELRVQDLARAHKRLESTTADLFKANARLTVTLKSIGDAVVTTTAEGQVTFLNDVAQQLTGWSQADAEHKSLAEVFQIVNQQTRQPVESPADKVIREGTIVGLANHTILLSRDGREIPIDDSGAPIRNENGAVIGIVLVFRDITERYQIEQERDQMLSLAQEARQKAEAADNLKLQFLAMVSHELRTPLTAIKGFSSTLLTEDNAFSPEEQRQFLQVIDEEADRLTELVEQLLDISRLQAGTFRVNLAPVKLTQIISSASAQLQSVAEQHRLKLNLADNLPLILADAGRMTQVLVNLVANAAKFSPAHTEIGLTAKPVEDRVQISVTDQGVGIPLEQRDEVFEAFRQVVRKEGHTKGAGLGLTICKGIVEAHGGQIWIETTEQPGTTFSLTIPTFSSD